MCSMGSNNKPCCAADALRCIRQITINGIPTGITMPGESIAEVTVQDLKSEPEIRAVLIKLMSAKLIPLNAEHEYSHALFEEYKKLPEKSEQNVYLSVAL